MPNRQSSHHSPRKTPSFGQILWGLAGFSSLGFFTLSLSLPVSAVNYQLTPGSGAYRSCLRDLQGNGVSPEISASACAGALRPTDISQCVRRITQKTKISGLDALNSCQQVRRPDELASCVLDINNSQSKNPPNPLAVMDFCRRSLLPRRFSQCVIGMGQQANFTTEQLMNICINTKESPQPAQLNTPPTPPTFPTP